MSSLLLRLSDNLPHVEKDSDRIDEKGAWLFNELKMLFSSRSRFPHIEPLPLVNASILNYGINVAVSTISEPEQRKAVIEERIQRALQRFEPRLTDVEITSHTDNAFNVIFEINALYKASPMKFELVWNDSTDKLYFYE